MLNDDDIRGHQRTAAVAVFQFAYKTPKSTDSVYAFVEGDEDIPFYTNFLNRFSDKTRSFTCGGKREVYKACEKMANRNYKGKALFFVDKDLSDIIPEKSYNKIADIYTTDYYSIENELVSEDILSKVWANLLHFPDERLDFDSLHQEKFQEELEHFYNLARPIMAWLIYVRRNGLQPKLKSFHFVNFFVWDDEHRLKYREDVQKIGLIKFLEQVCKVEETPSGWSSDAEIIINELSVLAPKAYIRGKLELCFFISFVSQLIKLLNKDLRYAGNKARMKRSLGEGNAVEELSRYANTPQSLEEFLRKNLKASA